MSRPPQHIRFCRSRDGVRIAYAIGGSGPPLIWLPHWMHHLELDLESPIWNPWLLALTRRHRVIRHDCRGCGLSDREGIDFSFERHIEDLEAVAAAAGLERFALAGMANGAAVAMAYAARRPERVSQLVLCGSYTRGRQLQEPTREGRIEARTRIKVIELGWSDDNPGYARFFTSLLLPDATTEQVRSFGEQLRRTTSPGNVAGLLETFSQTDLRDIAPRIRCPTLVFHSRADWVIPFDEGRAVAALIPGARFVPLESRNYVLLNTEPAWRQLVDELEAFLPRGDPAGDASELRLDELTPRERQILEIVAEGVDNRGIARRLGISEKTVRNQVSIILDKLGVGSRMQAIVRARDVGLGRAAVGQR